MWVEEDFIVLEQEEREITDEGILMMLFILMGVKSDIEKELRAFYQKYGQDGVVTYSEARKWISEQDHRRRLTALTLFVGGTFTYALAETEKEFRNLLTKVATKEITFFGVKIDIDKLLSRKWGVDNLNWLQRLEADVELWKSQIAVDIKQAMHQQKTLDKLLYQLDKRFKNIDRIMKSLGLSESTAVGSLSRYDIFRELGIKKYQHYEVMDERTCELCEPMHGKIFPLSAYEVGVTASPLHTNCRGWEVPIRD